MHFLPEVDKNLWNYIFFADSTKNYFVRSKIYFVRCKGLLCKVQRYTFWSTKVDFVNYKIYFVKHKRVYVVTYRIYLASGLPEWRLVACTERKKMAVWCVFAIRVVCWANHFLDVYTLPVCIPRPAQRKYMEILSIAPKRRLAETSSTVLAFQGFAAFGSNRWTSNVKVNASRFRMSMRKSSNLSKKQWKPPTKTNKFSQNYRWTSHIFSPS